MATGNGGTGPAVDHYPVPAPRPPQGPTLIQQAAPWFAFLGLLAGVVKYFNENEARAVRTEERIAAMEAAMGRDREALERRLGRMEVAIDKIDDKLDARLPPRP